MQNTHNYELGVTMKKRHFRAVRVKLECGHEEEIATSFYRLSKPCVSIIYGQAIRGGVWCFKCGALCQPVELLGTCRLY